MREMIQKRIELLEGIRPFLGESAAKGVGLIGFFKLALIITGFLTPLLFKLLIDNVMIQKELSLLKWICVGYISLYLLESLVMTGKKIYSNRIYNKLIFSIRRRLWQIYTRMPIADYEKYDSGDLKNRIDGDVDLFESFMENQVIDYLFLWIQVLLAGIILLVINWKLAFFGFCMVPISFWMTKWLGGGAKRTAEKYRETWGEYEGWLQESLQGWKEIKALNLEKRLSRIFTRFWHTLSIQFFYRQMYWYGNRTFIALKDFFITRMNLYFIGGLLIFRGDLTIGSLLVFMKYFEQFFSGIGVINNLDMNLLTQIPSIGRVMEIIGYSFEEGDNKSIDQSIQSIEFRNVSFAYPDTSHRSLTEVDVMIRGGERIAIVGRSGCGKSTLMKLLLGLYADYTGDLLLNGQDLRGFKLNSLHRKLGVVMQDSILFNMTVRENLLMAKSKATDDELKKACQMACIDGFIESLANKYDTLIGEKGIKLSGGQRQRLAIARLFLTNAEVVIFDEATSSLDYESEKMIHSAIQALSRDRTVIIVAHRLSSVLLADRVIVLDEGRIVAKGEHGELLGRNEVFDSLFKKQYEGMKVS